MTLPKLKKLLAGWIVALIMVASLSMICTQQMPMTGKVMMRCPPMSQGCQMSLTEHMRTFSQAFPSALTENLFIILLLVVVMVSVWTKKTTIDAFIEESIRRVRLREFLRRLSLLCTSQFFVWVFSRGILHAKRYA